MPLYLNEGGWWLVCGGHYEYRNSYFCTMRRQLSGAKNSYFRAPKTSHQLRYMTLAALLNFFVAGLNRVTFYAYSMSFTHLRDALFSLYYDKYTIRVIEG